MIINMFNFIINLYSDGPIYIAKAIFAWFYLTNIDFLTQSENCRVG